jgi:RND family efflux transporter MFP subunit
MFRKFFTLFGTVGILVGGVALIMLMGQMRPKPEREDPDITPPTVFYTTAEARSVTLDVTAQGEVRPRTDISLTAQVSGRVVDIAENFVNGGAFDKDDTLIRIEDADYRAASAGTNARVAQAEEALRREEAEGALARRDYEDLGREDDPTELALRIPQLAQARANFDAAKAEHTAALLNLERTRIRAPFTGRVRERIAGIGQYVSPGAQLGRIFSTDVAEIRLPLTDADLTKLGLPIAFVATEENPGPPVALTAFVAGEQREWTGRIARADGSIDSATRQVFVVAVVDDPYGAGADDDMPLIMGLFVDATIRGKPFHNAIVLPRSALHGRDMVYVIAADATLDERTVRIVSTDRDTITISGGVNPGERVVVSPLRGADDGDAVTPVGQSTLSSPEEGFETVSVTTSNAATNTGE